MVSPTSESPHMTTGRGMTGDVVAPDVTTNIAVATPTDRVRWGPIFAGLFSALSTLIVLSVLGIAVAGSSYDPGDRVQTFGQAAGWWGAVSALIAFFVGGMIAAKTAAVRGTGNGVLQGAMVWLVAIPLLMYLIGSVVSSAARSAGAMVSTAAQTTAAAANTPQAQQAANQVQSSVDQAQQQAQQTAQQAQQAVQNPQNQERAADATAKGAWGTLVSLLLGLGAAMVGGLVGARHMDRHHLGGHHGHHADTSAT